jgi:hypothetical protein
MGFLFVAVCVLGSAPRLDAQRIWIVDVSNGPRTDYTQIQPAVDAAQAGDIILVRPGATHFYNGFVVSKSITVTTETRGWWVRITSDVVVRGLPSGGAVMLKHLGLWYTSSLLLDNNAGTVYVERCQTGSQGGQLIIRHSNAVALNEVYSGAASIESSYVTLNRCLNGSEIAADPLLWVASSVVVFGNSILRGSRGNYNMVQCRLVFPPGEAIAGYDSLLILGAGTSILGGRLNISGGSCPPVSMEAAAIRGSNVRVQKDPAATLGIVTGVVTVQTATQPTLDGIVGDEILGRMDFDLWAVPGSAAALVASLPADPVLTAIGIQWANPGAHLVADVGIVDPTGHRKLSFLFPNYPLGQPMVFQSLIVNQGGLQWSTPSAIVRN